MIYNLLKHTYFRAECKAKQNFEHHVLKYDLQIRKSSLTEYIHKWLALSTSYAVMFVSHSKE